MTAETGTESSLTLATAAISIELYSLWRNYRGATLAVEFP